MVHLLRDLKRTRQYHKPVEARSAFSKLLKRPIRDSVRLCKRRKELSSGRFATLGRLHARPRELLARPWGQRHERRQVNRLRRHEAELFTFLDYPEVPSDNNRGATGPPAVIVRQNSYANRSDEGPRPSRC
ncbi:MAG: transposase [Isosphaeraceae bacterium]